MMKEQKNIILLLILFIYLFTYLVPAFKAIPRTPGEQFYEPIWLLFALLIYPKLYFSRFFIICFLFVIIDTLFWTFGVYNLASDKLFFVGLDSYFRIIFIPVSFFIFSLYNLNFKIQKYLFIFLLSAITTTTLTSSIALQIFPYASRTISSSGTDEKAHLFYMALNIGGYGFAYMVAIVSPIYLYFYRHERKAKWLLMIALSTIYLIKAQLYGAILIFVINLLAIIIITYFKINKLKTYLAAIIFSIFGGYFLKTFLGTILLFVYLPHKLVKIILVRC